MFIGYYQKKIPNLSMEDFRAKFSNFIYLVLSKFRKLQQKTIKLKKMHQAKTSFAKHAYNVITKYVKTKNTNDLENMEIPDEFNIQLACFVSIHNKDESLRGCIGTIEPREDNLWLEIISNAISACTRDSRFSAIEPNELDNIEVSVDVLSKPEKLEDITKLDSKIYGVIVTDGNYSRGVLLPDIDGIDTVEEQIRIAKRKAGLADMENEFLEIYSFTSTRYH